jgi:hypothetical protein
VSSRRLTAIAKASDFELAGSELAKLVQITNDQHNTSCSQIVGGDQPQNPKCVFRARSLLGREPMIKLVRGPAAESKLLTLTKLVRGPAADTPKERPIFVSCYCVANVSYFEFTGFRLAV